MTLMLSQSFSCPKHWNVLKGCAYDVYELQVHFWTWKFCHTGCRGLRFPPNDLPLCGALGWFFLPLSHTMCICKTDGCWHFFLRFLPSLRLFGCQDLSTLQKSYYEGPWFHNLCHDQKELFGCQYGIGGAQLLLLDSWIHFYELELFSALGFYSVPLHDHLFFPSTPSAAALQRW